jgi:hypothetical protein
MKESQPPVRIIHHWACSGGTVISKLIASLPRLVLFSEIHPYAFLRHYDPATSYAPTDIIRHLSGLSGRRDISLCATAFEGAILAIHRELALRGESLVLRSHSHVDFFLGAVSASRPAISSLLAKHLPLLELITIRHPLDSWLSLQSNNWSDHFRFSSFNEYCRRCLLMLNACLSLPMVKYEEFCLDPGAKLAEICHHLRLDYDPDVLHVPRSILLTGGSGRVGEQIAPRARRNVATELAEELSESMLYLELCERLSYSTDPGAPYPYSVISERRDEL